MGIVATVRTPNQVIALVCPDKANKVEETLVKAMETTSDEDNQTIIWVQNGKLEWATYKKHK